MVKNMIIEINKKMLGECGSLEKAILSLNYTIWTDERIKDAFNFGNGNKKDFDEYVKNNEKYCYFLEM